MSQPSSSFYAVINGNRQGPFDLKQLRELQQDGSITHSTLVWKEGMKDWLPFGHVEESFGLPTSNAPLPPPLVGYRSFEPPRFTPTESVPNHLVWAILSTVFCCLPFGIVSIVYAAQVNSKAAAGDIRGARAASKSAKTWAFISAGSIVIGFVIYMLIIAVGLAAAGSH